MINFNYNNIYHRDCENEDNHFIEKYSIEVDESEESLDAVLYSFVKLVTAAGYYPESLDQIVYDYMEENAIDEDYKFVDYLTDRVFG